MRSLIIKFILIFQFVICGWVHAEPENETRDYVGVSEERRPQSGNTFLQADHLFHSGDLLGAKPLYHDYLSKNSSGKRSQLALLRLGLIDEANQSYSTAIRFYQLFLQSFPRSLKVNTVRFNMAVCHYELAQYDMAEALLQTVLRTSPDKNLKWETMYRMAQIDGRRMDYQNAFLKFKKVYAQIENKNIRQNAYKVAETLINEKLGEAQVAGLIQQFQSGFPVDLLLLRKISLLRERGDISSYVSGLEKFLVLFPNHFRKQMVETWLNQVKDDATSTVKIGVVLPLTGKLSLTGQKVLQGIELALNQTSFNSRGKLALEVRDSGSNLSMKEVIADLAGLPDVVGIIGPLLSNEVEIAGGVAQQYKIPIFSPTASTHGLVDKNPYVFRNALTREIQAKFLAEYSVNVLNLRRFAVLHPYEPFGLELKDTFIKEVEALGGEVVTVSGYDRSQNDFKNQVLQLGGVEDDNLVKIAREILLNDGQVKDFSDSSVLSRPLFDMGHWTEEDIEKLKVSLELSYDAIFIPGVYDKVGLIIPQLAFYNVSDVTLLGANGWNSPELVKMGGKYIKSVFFVDGYYPDSHQTQVREFVKEFKANFGEEPASLSAQAFDAANIFIKNILAGVDNRIEMLEKLKALKNYPGVTGKTTMLPSGDSEKDIFALTVKRKKIVQEN